MEKLGLGMVWFSAGISDDPDRTNFLVRTFRVRNQILNGGPANPPLNPTSHLCSQPMTVLYCSPHIALSAAEPCQKHAFIRLIDGSQQARLTQECTEGVD